MVYVCFHYSRPTDYVFNHSVIFVYPNNILDVVRTAAVSCVLKQGSDVYLFHNLDGTC